MVDSTLTHLGWVLVLGFQNKSPTNPHDLGLPHSHTGFRDFGSAVKHFPDSWARGLDVREPKAAMWKPRIMKIDEVPLLKPMSCKPKRLSIYTIMNYLINELNIVYLVSLP